MSPCHAMSFAILLCLWSFAQSAECTEDDEPHAYQVSLLQHGLQVDAATVGLDLHARGEKSQPSVTANVRDEHSQPSVLIPLHHKRHTAKKSEPWSPWPSTAFTPALKEPSGPAITTLYCVNALVVLAMVLLIVRMVSVQYASDSTTDQPLPSAEDRSIGQMLVYVLIWAGLGITLICFNKYMYLDPAEGGFGFPCPIALTWWHMFTGMVFTNIVYYTYPQVMPAAHEDRLDRQGFWTRVVPLGFVHAFYLALSNMAYLHLSVSFVGMLKATGPLFVYCVSVAAGLESLTIASVVAIAIVVLGVSSASFGEMDFSWVGLAIQFTALCLDACRVTLIKTLMSSKGFKLDPISSLYYYSPVCAVYLFVPVIYFEGAELLAVLGKATATLFGAMVLNATVAFALNLSLFFLVSHVSPTSVSVASIIRDVILTFGSAQIFHTTITKVQVFGYITACLGVKLWNELKVRPGAFAAAFGMQTEKPAQAGHVQTETRMQAADAHNADANATAEAVPEASDDTATAEKLLNAHKEKLSQGLDINKEEAKPTSESDAKVWQEAN